MLFGRLIGAGSGEHREDWLYLFRGSGYQAIVAVLPLRNNRALVASEKQLYNAGR